MSRLFGLAFKNVFRQKKRSFTLGVNYAVVAFILVLLFSFSRGAAINIEKNLASSTAGQITLTGQFASGGKIYQGLLRTPDIVAAVGETFGDEASTLIRYGIQSAVYYKGLSKRLAFTGLEPRTDTAFRDQAHFDAGSWEAFADDPAGVVVPAEDAAYFGFALGDEIVLSTRTRFGAFNTGILVVRGIYRTDNYFARGRVLAHFGTIRDLDLAAKDASTSVFVYFRDRQELGAARDRLSAALAERGFDVSTPKNDSEAISAISAASAKYEEDKLGRDRIMVTLSTLDEVLGIVRAVLAAIQGVGGAVAAVMLFVVAVSIFINLRMSVNERLREIGTMRALGVEASAVTGLFVLESVFLALLFSAAGASAAVALALWMRSSGPTLPAGGNLGVFLRGGRFFLAPSIGAVAITVGAIAGFAAFFSFFPARRGGAIAPVEALTKTF